MTGDLLPRAVRALAEGHDAARALEALAALLVPTTAHWCLADVLQAPDLVTRVVARGADGPLVLPPEMGPVRARRSSAQAVGALARLRDAPGHRLRLHPDQLRVLALSEDQRLRAQAELALSLGSTDVLVLGLVRHDDLLGVLTVGRTSGSFSAPELDDLAVVASLAGLALESMRLRELQRGMSAALQRSLLPRLPVAPGISLAARFTPSGDGLTVGGDWYDAFPLPSGDLALVIGDATGHDVQAAVRMAELRNLLRALAIDQQEDPARTLGRLDQVIDRLAPELSGTCVYAQLTGGDAPSVRWSSAGHLPPVLLRDGRAELLETPADLMLGVQPGTDRVDHVRELRAGDQLVLYTDGLVEDRRAHLDDRLRALTALVEVAGKGGPERLADALVEQLAAGQDDVAVLVARVD